MSRASEATLPAAATRVAGPLRVERLLVPLLLALPLAGLGTMPLFDVDEGAFAEAAREMVASGDWLHTTLNGTDRFDKPIGVYWLQALAIALFGAEPWAVRLPSALALAAMAWATAVHLGRLGDAALRPWAWTAAAMLVTSLGFGVIGRAATTDALLNLLLALAFFDLLGGLRAADARAARAPLVRCGLWCGLGLLVKGPVALLIPGAALLLWCAAARSLAPLARVLAEWRGWLLLLAAALPWYLYALARHGQAFVDGFILRHNVERFTATLEGHGGSLAYYLVLLPLLWLPWSPPLLAVAARLRSLWAEPAARFALLWVGFVVAFFSLSGTKLPHYVLYCAAPLVLLLVRGLALLPQFGAGPRRALAGALGGGFALWLALLVGLPWLLPALASKVGEPLYRALLLEAPPPAPGAPLAAAFGLGLLALAWLRGRLAAPAALLLAAVLGQSLLAWWTAPWLGEALAGPVQRAALAVRIGSASAAATSTVPVVQWQVDWPSVAYTLGQPVPRRAPTAGDWVISRADRVPADAPASVVFHERGVVVLRWQGAAP
jgi:4-amino-4-deoxy-L-arabinose transferase-like glycosyltransferase